MNRRYNRRHRDVERSAELSARGGQPQLDYLSAPGTHNGEPWNVSVSLRPRVIDGAGEQPIDALSAPPACKYGFDVRGSDVLAVGARSNGSMDVPTIWTNGVAASLVANDSAFAEAIAIAGSDLLVAGHDGASAVYWKNGIASPLSHGSIDADGFSIAVYQH